MSDIRINQFANFSSSAAVPKKRAKHNNVSAPADQFQHTAGDSAPLDKKAVNKFFEESKNASEAIKQHSQYKPTPLVNGNTAGWQASIMTGRTGTNCFMKIPMSDKNKMLVVPLENQSGGTYTKPVVVDFEKGITDVPNVQPFGNTQGVRYAQSPDRKSSYLYNFNETRIDSYDENMKPTGSIDLSSIDGELGKIREFTATDTSAYVFAPRKDFNSALFMSVDPKTGKALWKKEFKENTWANSIKEGTDGNIYLVMSGFQDKKPSVEVYSPDGKLLKKFRGFNDPQNLTFTPDGNALVKDKDSLTLVKIKDKNGRLISGTVPQKAWKLKGDFRNYQVTQDGKYAFAVDTKPGLHRCHGLVKIDMNTGKVEWERKKLGEQFIDYKIVGNEISLMTSSQDRQTTRMTRLNMDGGEIWQGSIQTEVEEYNVGMQDAVSDNGYFVVGGLRDGNLSCLHPRKDGEDTKSIERALAVNERLIDMAKDSISGDAESTDEEQVKPEPTMEIHDDFVVIGGVKLDKKKKPQSQD